MRRHHNRIVQFSTVTRAFESILDVLFAAGGGGGVEVASGIEYKVFAKTIEDKSSSLRIGKKICDTNVRSTLLQINRCKHMQKKNMFEL